MRFEESWYLSLRQSVDALRFIQSLNGDGAVREAERCKFEAGTIANPVLGHSVPAASRLDEIQGQLSDLTNTIRTTTGVLPMVRVVYQKKIQEQVARVQLLKAVATGDMQLFKRSSVLAYGAPSNELFFATVFGVHERLKRHSESSHGVLRQAADALARELPVSTSSRTRLRFVAPTLVAQVRDKTMRGLGQLLTGVKEDYWADAAEIKRAFERALYVLAIDDWRVVIDSSTLSVTTNFNEKLLKIPPDRYIDGRKLRGLLWHEIGTHVVRKVISERSDFLLLRLGLPGYLRGEEGIAMMREQLITGAEDFAGENRYLAVGLAWGCDGRPRNFRELYTVMHAYYRLRLLEENEDEAIAERTVAAAAWKVCVRTFRGADGITRGACFTRDIIYREGNIAIWRLLERTLAAIDFFDIGKYDPTNTRHRTLLHDLGIMPLVTV